MTLADDRYTAAKARGLQEAQLFADRIEFESGKILLHTVSDKWVTFPIDRSAALAGASVADLKAAHLISGGAGLRFPTLKVTFYVPALARGVYGPAPEANTTGMAS